MEINSRSAFRAALPVVQLIDRIGGVGADIVLELVIEFVFSGKFLACGVESTTDRLLGFSAASESALARWSASLRNVPAKNR